MKKWLLLWIHAARKTNKQTIKQDIASKSSTDWRPQKTGNSDLSLMLVWNPSLLCVSKSGLWWTLSEEVLEQTVHDSDSLEENCQKSPEGEEWVVRVCVNSVNFNEEAFDPGRTLSREKTPAESCRQKPASVQDVSGFHSHVASAFSGFQL